MHTTNLRKVGGSVMLAVPPALLDVLQLAAWREGRHRGRKRPSRRGAAAASTLYPGRTAGPMQPQGPALRSKNENGSIASPSAVSSSDGERGNEARRNLARQSRSHLGSRAKGPPPGADRFPGALQPDHQSPRGSSDHKRRQFRAHGGFRRASDGGRNQNDRNYSLRPAPRPRSRRTRRQEAGKYSRRDHG